MNWVMRDLGPVLTGLTVGATSLGATVGHAFEIVRRAAWLVLVQRLAELADVAAELAGEPDLTLLGKVADDLRDSCADLVHHFRQRGETSVA